MGFVSWSLDFEIDDETAREALSDDLLWNAYPLGNVGTPSRRFMRVARARASDGRRAACVVFQPPGFAVVVPSGDADGVAAILAAPGGQLPPGAELMVLPQHLRTVERHATVTPIEWMHRIHASAEAWQPSAVSPAVTRLTARAAPALTALYREAAMPFHAAQVEAGVFHGAWQGDRLVAAAGTHNLSPGERVAALGNLYVRPEARRAGLGRALTVARVDALLASGVRTVVANVGVSNEPSLELHARLGFRGSHRFLRATLGAAPAIGAPR